MHLSDGVLPAPIWLGGMLVAGAAVAVTARRIDERRIPEVAVLTSVFFAASLIHFPLGGVSVHLLLTGLMGIILGWLSVPAIVIALFLQVILFGHGGLTTLGVNTVTLASGALLARALFLLGRGSARSGESGPSRPGRTVAAALVASLGGALASAVVFLAVMAGAGRALVPAGATNPLVPVALAVLIPQLLVALLDAAVCAGAVRFLLAVKPDLLPGGRCGRSALVSGSDRPASPGARMPRPAAGPVLLAVGATALLVCGPRPVHAHALEASVRVVDGGLKVEAFYAAGVPARGARVEVRVVAAEAGAGRLLAEGTTDAGGVFSFRLERAESLLITVDDGEGHRAEVDVPAVRLDGLTGPAAGRQPGVVGDSRGRWLSALGPPWVRVLAGVAAITAFLGGLRLASVRRRRRAV